MFTANDLAARLTHNFQNVISCIVTPCVIDRFKVININNGKVKSFSAVGQFANIIIKLSSIKEVS